MYVSAFGPRSMALAAAHGDGAVLSVPPQPEAMHRVWDLLSDGARTAGRALDRGRFLTCTLTTMVVLSPGESVSSARVREEAGAFAIAALHYSYEQWRQYGRRPPAHLADVWDDYVAILEEVPEERRHQRIHQGHNCWVLPEEERFVTPELIERTCLVGPPDELAARLRGLGDAGLDQVMLLPPLAVKEKVLADVAERVMPLL
jgi:alkanesulfonate monooxygenase SsuD/methylene tetrahydromethanopterin reductase-like flavin-dependent oxidoreductase (luciferase family)